MHSINFEIRRKLFHLIGIIFPLIYYHISKSDMVSISVILVLLAIIYEISRFKNSKITKYINNIFTTLYRKSENYNNNNTTSVKDLRVTGATYMALGIFIVCNFFDKILAITSLTILIFADSIAAITGIIFSNFSKKFCIKNKQYNFLIYPMLKYGNHKTSIGFIMFFITTYYVSNIIFTLLGYNIINNYQLYICALITSIFEFISNNLRIDDNLAIPTIFALSIEMTNIFLNTA